MIRERSNHWPRRPDYRIDFVPSERRVRATLAGETVFDTTNSRLMLETGYTPVYYMPRADVRTNLLQSSARTTFCPFKGEARYWHLIAGDRRVENAVWSYEAPFPEIGEIRDWMAFYWNALDHWYEEDEEVFIHPRDPYVRIDILPSSRRVRVLAGGETVAETRRACFLFETGHSPRFYIPAEDIRTDLLQPSNRRTGCPYKGFARYWSLHLGNQVWRDVVWSYPNPFDEAQQIKDLLCFYEEQVDRIEIDGEAR
jgi:uncharacterized protein (DUF427 family)